MADTSSGILHQYTEEIVVVDNKVKQFQLELHLHSTATGVAAKHNILDATDGRLCALAFLHQQMNAVLTLDSASSQYSSPFHFPGDIERLIFEVAAFNDIPTALQLARVAKRVQYW